MGYRRRRLRNTAWYTPDHLTGGQKLTSNQQLLSANGNNRLTLQADGNLVVNRVDTGQVLWASATQGKPMSQVVMQDDGNFVVYSAAGKALWSAYVNSPGDTLQMQNDGNLVVVSGRTPIWASGTGGR